MDSLSVVLGLAGAILILVGLIGGGFTFSGSVMPAVGKLARIPCLLVGGILVFFAIGLAAYEMDVPEGPSQPVAPIQAAPPPTNAPVIAIQPVALPTQTPLPTPLPAPVAAGVVMLDTYVFRFPALTAPTVGNLTIGTQVEISCTAQGEVVVRLADGVSSSLWNFVGVGFVPDIAIDTGTDQAVAGPC